MKKKVYLIHPSYRDQNGILLKGRRLYAISLALPALSAALPHDWEKECCLEYFEDVNLDTDATVIGISSMGYEIFRGIELAIEFRKRGKIVIFGGFQPHISREFVGSFADAVIHGYPGPADMARILADATSLEQRAFGDPVWIADQFLNPHETLIDMRQLLRLATSSTFFVEEVIGMNRDVAKRLLPPLLEERFQRLSRRRQLIALDLMLKPERYFVILRNARCAERL